MKQAWLKFCQRCAGIISPPRTARCFSGAARHEKRYIPRRAVLYIPGNDDRKSGKVPSLGVDCAVLDCEDGVAANRKVEARQTICQILADIDFGPTECAVRVNSVSSGLVEDDMKMVLQAQKLPQTLMLPKVNTVQELEQFTSVLDKCSTDKDWKPYLIVCVESAEGLLNLRAIFQRGMELSNAGRFWLDGVVFGSDDFCADIEATRTNDAKELLYARQKVVTTAKAFRLQVIDMVHIDYKDLVGLRQQSMEGAQMGFTGKQVIHPGQIPIVQEMFSPSPEKVNWAKQLIQTFERHQESGQGAFTFRGNMIDKPLLLQAKNIVQMAERTKR